jgi:hypothetical protein
MSATSRVRPSKPAATRREPRLHVDESPVQRFDELRDLPLGLEADVARDSTPSSPSRGSCDLSEKHHWLMRARTAAGSV